MTISLADAVVRHRAMHTGIEMQMIFMRRVGAWSEDGGEIAARCRSQRAQQIARSGDIAILFFDTDAAIVGQYERGDVDRIALGMLARDRARLIVSRPAGETRSGLDPHQSLAGIGEGQRRA